MIPRKARTKAELKKVIYCRKCLYTFASKENKISVICENCGKIIDARIRKASKDPNRVKKWNNWLKTVDWKEHRKEQNRKERVRVLLLVGKKDIKCVRCGCDDSRLLEINHKNGEGKKDFGDGRYMREFYRKIIRLERRVEDLEILCRVCNARHYLELKYGKLPIEITWNKN